MVGFLDLVFGIGKEGFEVVVSCWNTIDEIFENEGKPVEVKRQYTTMAETLSQSTYFLRSS